MRALSEQRVRRREQRVLHLTFNPERVLGGAAKLIVVLSLLQVMDWIENHGEAFLSKHTGVGKSLHRARALQKRHDDFEDVAQVSLYVFTLRGRSTSESPKRSAITVQKMKLVVCFLSSVYSLALQTSVSNLPWLIPNFQKPQCLLVAGSMKTCLYITIYGHKPFLKDLQKLLFIPEFQSFGEKKNTGTEVSLVKMKTKQRNWNWTSSTCFAVAYNTALRITKTWVTENLHPQLHIHSKLSDVDGMSQKHVMFSEDVSCLICLVLKSSKYLLSVCQSSALDSKQTEKSSDNIVCVQSSQILTVLLRLKRLNTHTHTSTHTRAHTHEHTHTACLSA